MINVDENLTAPDRNIEPCSRSVTSKFTSNGFLISREKA